MESITLNGFRRVVAAVLLLGLLVCTPAIARPALWVVRGDLGTVYLFGTVHLMPSDANWSSPELDKALEASQRLSIELIDDDAANMQAQVLKYGFSADGTLSSKLSLRDRDRLAKAADAARVPGGIATLDHMRPWLAAVTLSIAPLVQAGMDPALGVDRTLRKRMEAAGKPVDGLESAEQQLSMFANLSETLQLDFLRQTFDEVDQGPKKLRELIDAWRRGDVDTIAKIEDEDIRALSPELYEALLVNRNKAWAKTLATRLHEPGVSFVAVGAGHLAGPESVQKQLEKLGFTVQRL
ncbi:TraB/GumN family protein [Dyella terrae]|uniref:TraB/GumN family protein n=2 Tax=Dyella TaxID=231454 RepID=A0A4R0YW57_9GAMM|nr:TraB/GumN family protein [Dyella terrae]TCI13622.1 TraB/GumN family protein [Dyella soli]